MRFDVVSTFVIFIIHTESLLIHVGTVWVYYMHVHMRIACCGIQSISAITSS